MHVNIPYTEQDIMCPCGCREGIINSELVLRVTCAAMLSIVPLIISSWCRCESYNERKGGGPGSTHLLGEAVDILCNDGTYRFELIQNLITVGFKRIVIHDKYIHTDLSKLKTSPYLSYKGG